jgi:chemotaxis protein MotB
VLQAINGKQPPQLNVDEDDTETPADPREVDGMTTGQNGSSAKRDRSGPAPRNGIATGPQTFPHGGDFAAPQLTPVTGATTMTPSGRVAMTPANTAAMTQAATASMSPADAAMVQAAANAAATDAQHEQEALNEAATRLRSAIQQDPSLKDIADQLRVDNTPEGLRIQIVDKDNQQMFMLGNAALTARARELVQKVVPVLMTLPNAISIAGHTDAASYSGKDKTNWELSTDRANTTRRLLMDAGLPEARIRSVTGNADRDLLLPNDPLNAANRRISIVVLRHAGKAAP